MKSLVVFLLTLTLAAADDAAVQEFTSANNLFTQSAYEKVTKSKTGNFLISPFSAESVLALAQSGSKGESAEELRTALHLPNDKTKVEAAFKTLLPKFKSNDLYSLHTANKIYVKENFSVKDNFKTAASTIYRADIEPIDFTNSEGAANKINSWVEKHTNNKIKNLIQSSDLNNNTRAILINALYFKANWSNPFQLSSTFERDFHTTPTEVKRVNFLHHFEENFKYYECPHLGAQFLELPFKGEEASLTVVLPNEKNGLQRLENNLEQVFASQHQLESQLVNVALPKFKIESKIDFKTVLEKLGVTKIFDVNQADLSGVAGEKGDLYISKVVQKSFIDVSEEGVEAAAATYVLIIVPKSIILRPVPPKNFIADHPFIFYIKVKDLIIFAGRVIDPSDK